MLALSEGLPEVLSSSSAIPALVDGLKSGSPLMKSICGGEWAKNICAHGRVWWKIPRSIYARPRKPCSKPTGGPRVKEKEPKLVGFDCRGAPNLSVRGELFTILANSESLTGRVLYCQGDVLLHRSQRRSVTLRLLRMSGQHGAV